MRLPTRISPVVKSSFMTMFITLMAPILVLTILQNIGVQILKSGYFPLSLIFMFIGNVLLVSFGTFFVLGTVFSKKIKNLTNSISCFSWSIIGGFFFAFFILLFPVGLYNTPIYKWIDLIMYEAGFVFVLFLFGAVSGVIFYFLLNHFDKKSSQQVLES